MQDFERGFRLHRCTQSARENFFYAIPTFMTMPTDRYELLTTRDETPTILHAKAIKKQFPSIKKKIWRFPLALFHQ